MTFTGYEATQVEVKATSIEVGSLNLYTHLLATKVRRKGETQWTRATYSIVNLCIAQWLKELLTSLMIGGLNLLSHCWTQNNGMRGQRCNVLKASRLKTLSLVTISIFYYCNFWTRNTSIWMCFINKEFCFDPSTVANSLMTWAGKRTSFCYIPDLR